MDKELNKLETLVRNTSEKQFETPSKSVLRKIRFRLWTDDFFSVRPNKFNMLYAGVLATGIVALIFLTNEEASENHLESTPQITTEIPTTIDEVDIAANELEVENELEEEVPAFPAPEAIFNPDVVSGCSPLEVHFTNKSKHGKSYLWDFGNGQKSNLASPSTVFTEPGSYEVKLSVTNESGIEDVQFKNVVVRKKPVAALEIDIATSDIANREIHFNNLSKGAYDYTWDFGDNDGSSGEIVRHVYKDYGVYTVKLIAHAGEACSDTAEILNRFIQKNYELRFPLNFRPHPTNGGSNGYFETAGREASIFYPKNYGAKQYQLRVFTSSGLEVFSTKNIKQGWNGYIRGRLAPPGMYTYRAKGIYPNGKAFDVKGEVKLLVDDYYSN